MATNGRKAPRVDLTTEGKVYIYKADNHKLRFVFLLLMHQPSITYDGFDCGTGHSKEAMGGLITRMKKQFITDAKPGDIGAAAATGKKRGRSAKNAEDGREPAAKKGRKKVVSKDVVEEDDEEMKLKQDERDDSPMKSATPEIDDGI